MLRNIHLNEGNLLELARDLKKAAIYKKVGLVEARKALPGEIVVTKVHGGRVIESQAIATKDGDWVITGVLGEEYVVNDTKLAERFKITDKDGVYEPIGYARIMANLFGTDISLTPPWGGVENGDRHCRIAIECDVAGVTKETPYIIDHDVYERTYERI